MLEVQRTPPSGRRIGPVVWLLMSCLLHGALWLRGLASQTEPDAERLLQLPAQLDFGISDSPPGGGNGTREPAPKLVVRKASIKQHKLKAARDPNAYALKKAAAKSLEDKVEPAAPSGHGEDDEALGAGMGDAMGEGSGYAPAGATIALNVDLARVRQTALVLETQALLDIIPEWQQLLGGSGLDPLADLERVFVASPTLERSSVVLSASHRLSRARLNEAVAQLATEQGKAAVFRARDGFEIAPWNNRGPTERVIALTGQSQFTITRKGDLERVLQVASALGRARQEQGFKAAEVQTQGGLLAMQDKEAVALWIEGVHKYVPKLTPEESAAQGVPQALRLSIYHVDQFNTELRVRGQYASKSAAAAAFVSMDALRAQLSTHERVTFLGLKSALDRAQLEQTGSALVLKVRLTLHQTRYLMRFVTRALRPRAS
jgi:hypothetical protein